MRSPSRINRRCQRYAVCWLHLSSSVAFLLLKICESCEFFLGNVRISHFTVDKSFARSYYVARFLCRTCEVVSCLIKERRRLYKRPTRLCQRWSCRRCIAACCRAVKQTLPGNSVPFPCTSEPRADRPVEVSASFLVVTAYLCYVLK